MRIIEIGKERLVTGLQRITYAGADGLIDWALVRSSPNPIWVVCIHGHGSSGDQLYTREDIRDLWLPKFEERGLGVLTPNLRGNAWMSPKAAADLKALLDFVRAEFHAERFVFFSGSMGGTSNLIYAVLEPHDVAGLAALGAAPDLALYLEWLRNQDGCLHHEIATAIERAYGGSPDRRPSVYAAHSALKNADRLTMPVFLAHGEKDSLMPVEHARLLAEALGAKKDFVYEELPSGGHDAPLSFTSALGWLMDRVQP